jgi:hypothetical protein
MTRLIIPVLIALLVSGSASAQGKKENDWIFGPGAKKCTVFLGNYATGNLRKSNGQLAYSSEFTATVGWLQGYLTRVNEQAKSTGDIYGIDLIEIAAWLASWCRDNPTSNLINAMQALTKSRLKK